MCSNKVCLIITPGWGKHSPRYHRPSGNFFLKIPLEGIIMNKQHRSVYLPLILALALLAAFFFSTPVFAQDEVPTDPPPVVEATEVPTAAELPTEIVPVEVPTVEETPIEAASTEAPAVVETPAAEVLPSEEAPLVEPTEAVVEETGDLAQTLDAVADADLTLVDDANEPLTLANEEVVQTLTAPDPWFKVGTVYYRFLYNPPPSYTCADLFPGDLNCFESFTPLQDAVVYIRDHGTIPSDGFIHVDAGTLHNQVVTIDGSNVNLAKLKGIVGHVDPDTLLPDAILDNTLNPGSIFYMRNKLTGFTLSGFKIRGNSSPSNIMHGGVVDIRNCAGTLLLQDLVVYDANSITDAIMIISHNGSVTLKNIDSSSNPGAGAFISNLAGTAGVTVTNSSFDENFYSGLEITSNGAVVLSGVSASGNTGTYGGMLVDHAGSVTITNGVFNDNTAGEGLTIKDLTGNITLTNVYADGNKGGMTLTTKGNITLTDVSANGNTLYGADIDTCNGTPCVWLGIGKVTIINSNFDDNPNNAVSPSYFGLRVQARGAISLTTVSASRNGNGIMDYKSWGAYLDTSPSQLVSPVTITNGIFDENYTTDGSLVVYSKGAITLTRVKASRNHAPGDLGIGVLLDNTFGTNAGVVIMGTATGDNTFNENRKNGLTINTKGTVKIQYIEANYIQNDSAIVISNTGGTGSVTVEHAYFMFTGFGAGCLDIDTKGSVTLTDIEGYQCYGVPGYGGIQIDVHDTTAAVTVSGVSLDDSQDGGLVIVNRGNVTLTDISIYQSAKGLKVENSLGSGNVTLKNVTVSNQGIGSSGIDIKSSGAISLTNITSFNNKGYGAKLDNTTASSAKPVTITTGNFHDNENTGLYVRSKGLITLKDVNGIGNTKNDSHIGYDQMANDVITAGMIEKGWQFNGTAGDVIDIHANSLEVNLHLKLHQKSPYPMLEFDADQFGDIDIINYTFPATCNNFLECAIVLSDQDGNDLGGYHLEMIKNGGTLTDVSNLFYGADLENTLGTAGITITNSVLPADGSTPLTQGFTNNTLDGLRINTHGAVTLTNLYAGKNGRFGAKISNEIAVGTPAVTISNMRIFDNLDTGLFATSKGAITLKNAASWGQDSMAGADGAYLNNTYGNATISIINLASTSTLIRPGFGNNSDNGVDALSHGSLTMTNVNAIGQWPRQFTGLRLTNNSGTSTAGVTLTACRVSDNFDTGILVNSYGAILINGGVVRNNGNAAALHNETVVDSAPKSVTVNNVQFEENGNGLVIRSKGAVTLNNVSIEYVGDVPAINIDNSALTGAVTLTKVSAKNNQDTGILITSKGPVKITSCEAIQNFDNGIQITTTGPLGTVTITSTKVSDNVPGGIRINSQSTVTINSTETNNNSGEGITVETLGAISLANITANDNTTGVALYNFNSTSHAGISITGTNTFSNSANYGLYINSKGAVTLSSITAEHNGILGIYVLNSGGGLGNVTVNKVTTQQNGDGLMIDTNGLISLSSVISMLNSGTGIYLDSHQHNISFLNSVVAANTGNGVLAFVGSGTFTLANTLIFGNTLNLTVVH
jgi:hypothetical protein